MNVTKIALAISMLVTPALAHAGINGSENVRAPVNISVHKSKPSADPDEGRMQSALDNLEREYNREKAKLKAQMEGLNRWYKMTIESLLSGSSSRIEEVAADVSPGEVTQRARARSGRHIRAQDVEPGKARAHKERVKLLRAQGVKPGKVAQSRGNYSIQSSEQLLQDMVDAVRSQNDGK